LEFWLAMANEDSLNENIVFYVHGKEKWHSPLWQIPVDEGKTSRATFGHKKAFNE
jgi:hypothetical protein